MKNITTKEVKVYDKTLIIGHELSEYESVVNLLNASGMGLANPIKNGLMSAQKISDTLIKTHKKQNNSLEQLQINPLWDGLALDLLINNLEQTWWGWSDSNALLLLDYWKSLDSKIIFVLVYDTPLNFIKKVIYKKPEIQPNELKKIINDWCNYNQTLLKFYYHNQDCSLLVNTQQVKVQSTDYLKQIAQQVGISNQNINQQAITIIQKSFQQNKSDNDLFNYLAQDLLKEYPEIIHLYDELQSVANFPLYENIDKTHSSLDAISSLLSEQHIQQENIRKKDLKEKENNLLLEQLLKSQEELNSIYQKGLQKEYHFSTQLENAQEKIATISQREAKIKADLNSKYTEEKNLLLQQLRQVQTNLNEKIDILSQREAKIKADLDHRYNKEKDLLQQLMQVQEILDKYYTENKNLKEKLSTTQKASSKAKPFGAAERIKNQLSYRLGSILISHSKSFSGILKIPFSLYKEIKKFRKDQKLKKKSPPIESYADAYEAVRVKQHLSYKLGQTMIKYSNQSFGYFKLPWALRKVYKEYKQDKLNVHK